LFDAARGDRKPLTLDAIFAGPAFELERTLAINLIALFQVRARSRRDKGAVTSSSCGKSID
jgi:hypothetical protein